VKTYAVKRVYDVLKAQPELRYAALRMAQSVGVRSLVVKLDTNWMCNLRCRMCHFSAPVERAKRQPEMDHKLFSKIAKDLFPRAHSVALSCGAEPMMSKHFPQFIEEAGQYNLPHLSYCTNGLLLSDGVMKTSLDCGVKEVIFSIEAATPETYAFLRVGGTLERFHQKISRFHELRGDFRYPEFRFNAVAMQQNVDELPDMMDMAARYGVATVQLRHLGVCDNMQLRFEEASLAFAPERFDAVLDEVKARAQRYGIRLLAPEKFSETEPHIRNGNGVHRWGCINPWFAVYIMPNGDYRPCLWLPAQGSFKDQSYDEIVSRPGMRRIKECLGSHPEASCLPTCQEKRGVLHSVETARVAEFVNAHRPIPTGLNMLGRPDEDAQHRAVPEWAAAPPPDTAIPTESSSRLNA